MHCAKMNSGTEFNEIPEKDSLNVRARVIAGFAKDGEDVNM